jgi:aromatic-amino-acid transaminase
VTPEGADRATVQANLAMLNRLNYSFPPDHGARLVQTVLDTPALRADWQAELEEVRLSMLGLRQQLADELRKLTNSDRFDFVARHRGMFSRLGLTPEQVARLRADHAIYMVGDSRINIAGLNADSVPVLARAIASVL